MFIVFWHTFVSYHTSAADFPFHRAIHIMQNALLPPIYKSNYTLISIGSSFL